MSRAKWAALWACFLLVLPLGRAQSRAPAETDSAPQFQVATDVVRLAVSVTDHEGRPFTGLARNDIEVYEDKIGQEIAYFIPDRSPIAEALVLDSSGSMRQDSKMERARAAALHFVQTGHADDDVLLVDFGSEVTFKVDFTADEKSLAAALATGKPEGTTALYDAVYLALDKLNRYQTDRRKVILLISDGADTGSLYTLDDVRELARESEVQIYAVGILGQDMSPSAVSAIRELAEITGGAAFFPMSPSQMVNICHGIAVELHEQYLLAYRPTNPSRDGQWRTIQVKIKEREGRPDLVARTRKGYLAPVG